MLLQVQEVLDRCVAEAKRGGARCKELQNYIDYCKKVGCTLLSEPRCGTSELLRVMSPGGVNVAKCLSVSPERMICLSDRCSTAETHCSCSSMWV